MVSRSAQEDAMPTRTPAFVLAVILASAGSVIAQRPAPSLSKEQRQALLAAVTAAGTAPPLAADQLWQLHLLRASDGSHYVAFSVQAPADLSPGQRLALYVRLEPRAPTPDATTTAIAPRSAVEEWLLGQRRDPLPMQAKRVVTIPTGEMPIGGLAATSSRDGSGQNSAVLGLMERQRQKEREEREARERARREELEGRAAGQRELFPFEDFDMAAHVVAVRGRPAVFRRALTAGPGSYDVVLGWAVLDDKNRPTRTGSLRRFVTLPAAQSAQLQLGSVIIADAIQPQDTPYPAEQQTSHPYSIGSTSIEPAADDVLTNDERLAIAFQILNATATPTGKPDIGIALRLFRRTAGGEEPAATLAPLNYNEETLPGDFNLYQGHPLIAAFAAPLRTLARGDYRLAILATDRLSRTSTTTDARFRIAATPAALLADAPPVSAPVRRSWFVDARVLDRTLATLAPPAASPALQRLLALAGERRFVDLMVTPDVPPSESGLAGLLQTMAAYALGETPRSLAVQLKRARDAGAPPGAMLFFLGATHALDGHDSDALRAWTEARAAGWPQDLLAVPMAEARLRLGNIEAAGALARDALAAGAVDPDLTRLAAAADVAARRYARAIEVLTPRLLREPEDTGALWVMLHALFASLVAEEAPGATTEGRAQIETIASRYIAIGGPHRALAEEWRAFATSSGPAAP
jgi:hypothetical protein